MLVPVINSLMARLLFVCSIYWVPMHLGKSWKMTVVMETWKSHEISPIHHGICCQKDNHFRSLTGFVTVMY